MATTYWEHRATLRQAAYDRANNRVVEAVSRAYDRAARQLDADIATIMRTYQRKTGLTPQEAMEFLNGGLPPSYLKELLARVAGITDKQERLKLETLLRTDRYQGRISRLDAIKAATRVGLTEAAEVELGAVTPHLRAIGDTAYSRMMYDVQHATQYGFRMAGVPRRSMDTILKTRWAGEAFSQRIWQNRDAAYNIMTQAMSEIVGIGKLSQATLTDVRGMVDLNKWAGAAKSKFKNVAQYQKYAANRLIRTESAYVANQTTAIAYDECGIEAYEFIATLDGRTSDYCQRHDGLIDPDTGSPYDVAKKEIGKNWPPLHPFCRSTTAPVLEGQDRSVMQRAARGKDGKTTKVPRDMQYAEWKRWQDDGAPDIASWRMGETPKAGTLAQKVKDAIK